MENITIYHNPRCSKSRQALQLLTDKGASVKVTEYLKEVPSKKELKNILDKLEMSPAELIRTNETIWKDNFKGKQLSNDELIDAMIQYPKLIERPIAVKGNKAIIGRPPENVLELI